MTHWNHRVVKKYYPKDDYTEFAVKETFYNEDGSIYAYTQEPAKARGNSLESLRQYLEWCLKALDQPILVDGEVIFNDGGDGEENWEEFDSVDDFIESLDDEIKE